MQSFKTHHGDSTIEYFSWFYIREESLEALLQEGLYKEQIQNKSKIQEEEEQQYEFVNESPVEDKEIRFDLVDVFEDAEPPKKKMKREDVEYEFCYEFAPQKQLIQQTGTKNKRYNGMMRKFRLKKM